MDKKTKISNFIFSGAFLVMIALPFCLIDTTPTIASDLENRNLTEWPGLHFSSLYNEWYGHYAEDRVGFRDTAIAFNNQATYKLFGEFAEEIHMNGKDGYVFPADDGYVQNYQRINVDADLLNSLSVYLANTNAYAEKKGIAFYAMVCPNKSSVYGDYMPDYIIPDENKMTGLDTLKNMLDDKGVSYVIPDEEFKERAKSEQIYNLKYDGAHWNDLGAVYGLSLLDEKIAERFPEIRPISMGDFSLSYKDVDLELFSVPVKDTIPVLQYNGKSAATESADMKEVTVLPGNNISYFYNEDAESDKTILILHDSFLDDRACYYYGRYKEVYYGARVNYTHMKEYMDVIQPDVVVFEVAERSFADDLYAYTELATISYEDE